MYTLLLECVIEWKGGQHTAAHLLSHLQMQDLLSPSADCAGCTARSQGALCV